MKTDFVYLLVTAQLVIAALLNGIIWLVQIVSYPQFLDVGVAEFGAFHANYTAAITPVVAPLMIAEFGLALLSAWLFRWSSLRWPIFAGAAIVAAIWLTTFLIQVPLHETLAQGRSEAAIRKLIESNWTRTALWGIRLLLLFGILFHLRFRNS